MAIDPSVFFALNVTDTCAVWNILSSRVLYEAARLEGCQFSCTAFVDYECLVRPRSVDNQEDEELKNRLHKAKENDQFQVFHLDLEELNEVGILEKRKSLGKGELSSIAFANRTRQAFLTDDQKARKLASEVMSPGTVQTTPHLLGWLIFKGSVADSDFRGIATEHVSLGRPLAKYFVEIYHRALKYRLMAIQDEAPESHDNAS